MKKIFINSDRFPFKLDRLNAKKIIDIACSSWKSKLIKKWAESLLINDYIMIEESFYKEMRIACNTEQNQIFDTIFGIDVKKEINLRDASTLDNLELFKENGDIDTSLIAIFGGIGGDKMFWLNPNFEWGLTNNFLTIGYKNE